MKNIGIIVFDGVEELDFVGPLEVFGVANRLKPNTIRAFTLEAEGREIQGAHGLRVKPEYSFQVCPKLDVLVVPGGRGARREMQNSKMLAFVKKESGSCELVTSVCTGALILAAAGLLDGKRATTHWAALEELKQFPKVTVEHQRYIHEGKNITAGGISAGIDMALYVIELLYGRDVSEQVANRMEYRMAKESVS